MNLIAELPPALILVLGAVLLPWLPRGARPVATVLAPLLALAHLAGLPAGAFATVSFAGFDLVLLSVDRFNFVFGTIFLLIGAIASVYAWHVRDLGQQVASQLYAAGALGVTFAGDFLTLLIFWEVMAVASAWLIFARRRPESTAAGFRYLLVHLAGGTALLAGILLHYGATGSLLLGPLDAGGGLAPWLVLLGVALNAAIPPLHPWLPDAYPQATVTGAIFMSALTTKSAVYVLMKLFAGWDILIGAGVVMALYGVVYAVLANDIRQILAYHIVSQVGYMVTGVGIGTELALNGTAAHAFSHILYKALLFMGAGAVIEATGRSKLTELGGLGRRMRAVLWLFMIGAFSISGFPLFNGFISKSIIVSAAGEAHHAVAMLLLLLASVGTFLHTGLKIPVFTFWGPDRGLEPRPLPANMYVAMAIVAFLCVFFGVAPGVLYALLPYAVEYHPYTSYHLVEATQLLVFTFVGFWVLRDKLAGEPYLALDTDWFYRRGGRVLAALVVAPVNAFFQGGVRLRDALVEMVVAAFGNPRRWFQPWREDVAPFDPGRERGLLGASVGFVVAFLVVFSLLALWW
jgi:multicomponent Na+:H+ antiporter subunit D